VAATLRDHGVAAELIDRGDAADVMVSAARRDDAVAVMASHMDEIRDRVDDGGTLDAEPSEAADEPAGSWPLEEEPGSRRMVFERLRRMWPVPVMLVPLLLLLGLASVPANFAVIAMIGGMVAVVALRQGRRAPWR
jgi:hypothetical protein